MSGSAAVAGSFATTLNAAAVVMAAGFLITRILLLCLYLIELNYSSAVPTARQDGEKKQANGFGTRRPLHYIRALRHRAATVELGTGY
ncbi:unnamed protein product [Menidia menidia]|uniref:(Atlantic silverside) hypothetical protein n=1 Tax=Menidia menidia TaxID=238744 RepID=A0A8S4BMV1_9TELE|nr:unnamed protein product [Menidia menidia]